MLDPVAVGDGQLASVAADALMAATRIQFCGKHEHSRTYVIQSAASAVSSSGSGAGPHHSLKTLSPLATTDEHFTDIHARQCSVAGCHQACSKVLK